MRLLANAFSLGMLEVFPATVVVESISLDEAKVLAADATSVVGHADTACLFTALLKRDVAMNRASTRLFSGDELVVGQYTGERLTEGATCLPEGAKLRWLFVTIA